MTDMAYIARKSCGCLVMATVDNPDHSRDVAREVAKCVRMGWPVERITVEAVREIPLRWESCRFKRNRRGGTSC